MKKLVRALTVSNGSSDGKRKNALSSVSSEKRVCGFCKFIYLISLKDSYYPCRYYLDKVCIALICVRSFFYKKEKSLRDNFICS